MKIDKILLTEKYRPSFEDIILPAEVLKKFKDGLNENILLYGPPGTGKTSLAKAIVKHFGHPYLFICGSSDGGKDKVVNDIPDFCSTTSIMSSNNKLKVVIIDEAEGASPAFFKALRSCIEEYASNTRFIIISNYINKITDPVISRFNEINFDFSKEERLEIIKKVIVRVNYICKQEGLTISIKALEHLVKTYFPDIRKIINVVHGILTAGKTSVEMDDIKNHMYIYKDLFNIIIKNEDPLLMYKKILGEYSGEIDSILLALNREFIEYIEKEEPDYIKYIPQLVIKIRYYQGEYMTTLDPVMTLPACIFEIQNIIKGIK